MFNIELPNLGKMSNFAKKHDPPQTISNSWCVLPLRVIDGKNVNFSILSDFDETRNKWCSCHSKAKCKQIFQKFWTVHSLRVVTGDWQKNPNFSSLSDFDETQNKWCFCLPGTEYQQKFQKIWKYHSLQVVTEWLMEKMSIFHFFLILMKLKTNDYLPIPKQNVNKFFKKIELFARYRWLWVIDGKNLNFLVCPILIKLEMHAVLVILKQNMNRFFKKIVRLANRLSFLLQECGHIWKSPAFLFYFSNWFRKHKK